MINSHQRLVLNIMISKTLTKLRLSLYSVLEFFINKTKIVIIFSFGVFYLWPDAMDLENRDISDLIFAHLLTVHPRASLVRIILFSMA